MKERAFTLVELLTVIGIVFLLLAICFPVFFNIRKDADKTTCLSQLKNVGIGLLVYTQDNDGYLPSENVIRLRRLGSYFGGILPYCPMTADVATVREKAYACQGFCGYALNPWVSSGDSDDLWSSIPLAKVTKPTETVWFTEQYPGVGATARIDPFSNPVTGELIPDDLPKGYRRENNRHFGGSHVLFVDAHVKWFLPKQVKDSWFTVN